MRFEFSTVPGSTISYIKNIISQVSKSYPADLDLGRSFHLSFKYSRSSFRFVVAVGGEDVASVVVPYGMDSVTLKHVLLTGGGQGAKVKYAGFEEEGGAKMSGKTIRMRLM